MRIILSLALALTLITGISVEHAAGEPDGSLLRAEPVADAVVRGVFGTIQARVDMPVAAPVSFGFAGRPRALGHVILNEPTRAFQGFGFAGHGSSRWPLTRVVPLQPIEVQTADNVVVAEVEEVVEQETPRRKVIRRTYRRPVHNHTYAGSSVYSSTYSDCGYTYGCSSCCSPCYRPCHYGCGYRVYPRLTVGWGWPGWGYGWGRPWGWGYGWGWGGYWW